MNVAMSDSVNCRSPIHSPRGTCALKSQIRSNGSELFLNSLGHLLQILLHFVLGLFQQILLCLTQPASNPSPRAAIADNLPVKVGENEKKLRSKTPDPTSEKKKRKKKKEKAPLDGKDGRKLKKSSSPRKGTTTTSPPTPTKNDGTTITRKSPREDTIRGPSAIDKPTPTVTKETQQKEEPKESLKRSKRRHRTPDSPSSQDFATTTKEKQDEAHDSSNQAPELEKNVSSPHSEAVKENESPPTDNNPASISQNGDSLQTKKKLGFHFRHRGETGAGSNASDHKKSSLASSTSAADMRDKRSALYTPTPQDVRKSTPQANRRPSMKRAATVMDGLAKSPTSDSSDQLRDRISPPLPESFLDDASLEFNGGKDFPISPPSEGYSIAGLDGDEGRRRHFPRRAFGAFTKRASQVLLPSRSRSSMNIPNTSCSPPASGSSPEDSTSPFKEFADQGATMLSTSPIFIQADNGSDADSSSPSPSSPPSSGGGGGGSRIRSSSRAKRKSLNNATDLDKVVNPNGNKGGLKGSLRGTVRGEGGGSPPSPLVLPRFLVNTTKRVFSSTDNVFATMSSESEFDSDGGSASLADRLGVLDTDWANFMPLLENEGDTEPEYDENDEKTKEHKATLQHLEEMCWRLICGEGEFKRITYRSMLHKHLSCFSGSDLVTWIYTDVGYSTRNEAVAIGQQLLDEKVIHHVFFETEFVDSNNSYYRLMWDSKLTSRCHNACKIWRLPPRNALTVVKELNEALNALLNKFYSKTLGEINLEALKASRMFYDFSLATAELQRVNFCILNDEEIKLFFINVYNILFIHGQLARGDPGGHGQQAHARFFSETSYILRRGIYSLNDIQHGMLRGDDGKMSRWKGQSRWVKALDTPGKWKGAQSMADPRLHFVLIGGNVSKKWITEQGVIFVPLITLEKMEKQLTEAVQYAIEEEVDFAYAKKEISLPKVFKWYASDFGQTDDDVLNFLMKHYPEGSAERNSIATFLSRGRFTVKYKQFNWPGLGLGAYL